jgi:hypothetical protein
MNTTSNTRLRLTTQVGQAHAATGVQLDLGTNSQPHRPENAVKHKTRASLTYTGQAGEHHRSDRSLLVKSGDFHITALHRSGWCTGQTDPSQKAQKQQTGLQSSKLTHQSDRSGAAASLSSVLQSWLCGSTKEPSGFLVNHRKPRELGVASANLHS